MTNITSNKFNDLGLLIARVGMGLIFVLIHGLPKLTGGPERWKGLGGAMQNLGITWYPEFWGFMAMAAEVFGGILLIVGLFSRPAAFFLAFNMFVAMMSHFARLDPWGTVSHPMKALVIFAALLLIGPGKYSIDNWLKSRKKSKASAPPEVK